MRYVRRRRGRNWAKWLYAALFAAVAVGCGARQPGREASASGIVRNRGGAIRPMAPLSGSVSGSRAAGVLLQRRTVRARRHLLRPCLRSGDRVPAGQGRSGPARDAAARRDVVLAGGFAHGPSAVWQLAIPSRDSGLTTAFGVVPDYNGDGLADVAIGVRRPPGEPCRCRSAFLPGPGVRRDAARRRRLRPRIAGGRRPEWRRLRRPRGRVGRQSRTRRPSTTAAPRGPTMGVTLLPVCVTAGFGADDGQRGRRRRRRLRRRRRRRRPRSRRSFLAARACVAATAAFSWRAPRSATR